MKRLITPVFLLLVFILLPVRAEADVIIRGEADFDFQRFRYVDGTFTQSTLVEHESEIIEVDPFTHMVISWNADAYGYNFLTIWAMVRVDGEWTDWMAINRWTSSWQRLSFENRPEDTKGLAYLNVDVVSITNDRQADAFRYRVTMDARNDGIVLRNVFVTFRNTLNDITTENTKVAESDFFGTLDVKPISQMTRDPKIANRICGPTSVAMLMDYYGIPIMPEMVAMGVYDIAYRGFGNRVFNTAFLGTYGFKAYVEYMPGISDLRRELSKGNPVIVSVRHGQSEDGTPSGSALGHILVVVGYERGADGGEYVVVNDPAAENDEGVRLALSRDEFLAAWEMSGRAAYRVQKIEGRELSAPEFRETALIRGHSGRYYVKAIRDAHVHPSDRAMSVMIYDEENARVISYPDVSDYGGIMLTDDEAGKVIYVFSTLGAFRIN